MARLKLKSTYVAGDRIALSAAFLRNTGQFAGHAPFLRGTYVGPDKHCPATHARVHWDDIEQRIASGEHQYADPEYCAEVRANGSLVALSAIAKVGTLRHVDNSVEGH